MRGIAKSAVLGVVVSGLLGAGCLEELLEVVSVDMYEPNDTHAEAAPITDSPMINADFFGDPVDWFVVSTTDDVDFTVVCTPTGSLPDVTLTLYDDGEVWLADDDDGAANPGSQTIVYPAPDPSGPGNPIDYYIKLECAVPEDAIMYVLVWHAP